MENESGSGFGKGSEWIIADLHLHTPSSFDYKNKNVTNEEIVQKLHANDVQLVAVTDHHLLDVDRFKILHELGEQIGVRFLPGIEMRCTPHGKEPLHAIAIFSDEIDTLNLWKHIDVELKIAKQFGKGRNDNEITCSLSKLEDLVDEFDGLLSIHAGNRSNSIDRISNTLPHNQAVKEEIANSTDIFEVGKFSDIKVYEERVLPNISKRPPIILCSDNHNIREYDTRGASICWVKCMPTFEGLRQILFEPETRVQVLESGSPREPLNKIESFTLKVPDRAKVRYDEKETTFCLSGLQKQYFFSPYLNCVIGGRGTGKSTLLSLIAAHSDTPKQALKKLSDFEGVGGFDLKEIVELTGTSDFEYISQNDVEKYANDPKSEFSKALYSRIRQLTGESDFDAAEESINEAISELKRAFDILTKIEESERALSVAKSKLKTLMSAYNTIKDESYLLMRNELESLTKSRAAESVGKKELLQLVGELKSMQEEHTADEDERKARSSNAANETPYVVAYTDIIQWLPTYSELPSYKAAVKHQNTVKRMTEKINEKQANIANFLRDKGMDEETINDSASLVTDIARVKEEIEVHRRTIELLNSKAHIDYSPKVKPSVEKFSELLDESVVPVQDILNKHSKDHPELETISLTVASDERLLWSNVGQEVYIQFKVIEEGKINQKNVVDWFVANGERIESLLTYNIEADVSPFSDFANELGEDTQYEKFIRRLLTEPSIANRVILIALRHLSDKKNYLKIDVEYDGFPLPVCSFGQKCTAVLVLFLLFGNKPLIIDEPEAHLDGNIVAKYLVPIIKKGVKERRQLIFATHNANFVVNGDAEKIFILEQSGANCSIKECTIENLAYRKNLLMLEGGKEAFKKRGAKYSA